MFLDKHFWVLDNKILYDGCPMDKWISKFFPYSVLSCFYLECSEALLVRVKFQVHLADQKSDTL